MKTIKVNQARIEISSNSCCDCGGPLDSDAREAGAVGLSVAGIQRSPIQLWRCAKCAAEIEETPELPGHMMGGTAAWCFFCPICEANTSHNAQRVCDECHVTTPTTPRCEIHGTMMPCTLEHQ